ncbi:MAG: pyrimidine reductase family protein [Nocardioidaceae bacterium]
MRRLYPNLEEDVDLAAAYSFPDGGTRWVRANFVSSVDGAATVGGRSGGLGNKTDHALFSLLRGLADVILVGAGTVHVEHYEPVEPTPLWGDLRVGRPPTPPIAVVSKTLDFDLSDPLFNRAPERARTIVLTCESAPAQRRRAMAEVADMIVAGGDWVEPVAAVDALATRGHTRISCEGGPRLLAQLAAAGCLDELCLTLSPLMLAGGAPRIANGTKLPEPLEMSRADVLEDEGYLFLRYQRRERPARDRSRPDPA